MGEQIPCHELKHKVRVLEQHRLTIKQIIEALDRVQQEIEREIKFHQPRAATDAEQLLKRLEERIEVLLIEAYRAGCLEWKA